MRKFRIGSTSYVYPDDILPNARRLAGIVEDMELVLFEVDHYGSNLPTPAVIRELVSIAADHDMTYTVHLPLDLKFGDAVSNDKARRAIEATHALDPYAYVMHLDGRALLGQPDAGTISQWQAQAQQMLEQVIEWVGAKHRVCVENVEAWDPEHLNEVVRASGVSRCVDIGHLWLQGGDPLPHLIAHLPRTRVIHLHGIARVLTDAPLHTPARMGILCDDASPRGMQTHDSLRDHQSLTHISAARLHPVLKTLLEYGYAGVLTLEVFSVDDFFSSHHVLVEAIRALEL